MAGDDSGVTALEFAVVFPLFLFTFFFLFKFSLLMILMNRIDRVAIQASYVARSADNPSAVTVGDIETMLADSIPDWIYVGSGTKKAEVEVRCGDNLQIVKNATPSSDASAGMGSSGQTVCLKVSVHTEILGFIPVEYASPTISRSIVNCYVNWDKLE